MAQPILYKIPAFDAKRDYVISFSYIGNQVFANRLILRDNITDEVVYNEKVTTFQLQHVIPALSLTNGIAFNAEICVYDVNDVESSYSTKLIFYCYSTPVFKFKNLIANQTIQNSSFQLELFYEQLENETLNSYHIVQYNGSQIEIFKSPEIYNIAELSYYLLNLDDSVQYYVQAVGETLNNMVVDTGLIPFSVRYSQPAMFAIVNLENNRETAEIKIISNIKSIVGRAEPPPAEYIDNEKIDLSTKDSKVIFDEGFSINHDFTLEIALSNSEAYFPVLNMSNEVGSTIELTHMKGIFESQNGVEKTYYLLRASSFGYTYVIYSNYIDVPLNTDNIKIFIRRINNIYSLYIENKGGV